MARKTEMPEDIRRMTAEMRKAHDNPDPRPQLKRGNPKAVSAAEATAQLQAIRESAGNGSADEMLGSRMNPLIAAAGATSATAALATTFPTLMSIEDRLEKSGVKSLTDVDGLLELASLGMVIRGGGLSRRSVRKADQMLAGRKWVDLTRREKLAIKKATGLEKITGGYDEWVKETATDPVMSKKLVDLYLKRRAQRGRRHDTIDDADLFDPYSVEDRLGPVSEVFEDNGSGYIKFLKNKPYRFEPTVRLAERQGWPAGTYHNLFNEITLYHSAERGVPAGKAIKDLRDTAMHELTHASQHISSKEFSLPYHYRPSEEEAYAVSRRTNMTPTERASSLIEDSRVPLHEREGNMYPSIPYYTDGSSIGKERGKEEVRQASKGGSTSGASGVRQASGGGAAKISYEDLRKLADASYKGDIRAAVYSLDPKVVTATVDSFGGNIDRTNRPMYIHRDKNGKPTGYSTTNSGDALDRGVKPEGRFQSVLVPFVRQGKDGPEYTEDYNVAQKWYDESGQHYGKFDMDFTTPEAKARSIDRFNAASWLVHREQQLRYQPEFDKLVEAERRQAAKAGDAGRSKSSGVPSGHNPSLDGYSGPRVIINPQVMKDDRDALCVAFNESFRIIQEINGFDPVAEPTEKQRAFFADTAYRDDERMLRRTILSRICTFDTSVTDPTDEQLQEAVEFLDTVLEIGAPQNQWEQRAVERIRTAIERSVGQPRTEEENPKPPAEGPAVAAAGGGETEEEALTRLAAGDTGKTLQEDTSTIEEREKFLEERGMDKSLAEAGSMDTLIKMHEQRNGVPPADAAQTRPDAPATDAKTDGKTDGKPALTNADVLASKDAVEFVAANGGGTTGNGISVDAGAKVMDDGRIIGSDGNARNADGKIDNFGRSGEMLAEMQQQANPVQEQHEQNSPQTASERTGTTPGIKGLGGRELTAGEAAWQARKQASTAAWMQRTGRSGDGVADALQDTNNQQQAPAAAMDVAQNSPQTASERIGTTSGIKGLGGRELTAGEAAWQARKQASTAAWMQRTGRSSDGVADALAQRDERANNLRQNSQVDSGRRDLLGRRLDDRGRVIV